MVIYEILFVTFPIELYEWIMKLANTVGRWKLEQPIVWTPELVRKLETIKDRLARAVEHWLDQIIGGFIIEFMIDTVERPKSDIWEWI